jgi:L-lactate dehydrogenase complex protein LldG
MSREAILAKIKKNKPKKAVALPSLDFKYEKYKDKNKQVKEILSSVGAKAFWGDIDKLDDLIKQNFDDVEILASTIEPLDSKGIDLKSVKKPHDLKDVDLAVIKGEFCVAENGAVWVLQPTQIHRALYFIAKKLLFVVKKENIVDTMHDAYKKIDFENAGYGVFISGPSKTADIEQTLVIGAHGALEAGVVFI